MAVSAPRNLTGTAASSSQINLTWSLCDSPARLVAFCSKVGGGFIQQHELAGSATSDSFIGLQGATTYELWVHAYGTDRTEAESTHISVTTDTGPSAPTAPSALTLTTLPNNNTSLQYSFSDNSSNETDFQMELFDQITLATRTVILPAALSTGTVSGILSNLSPAHTYRCRVRARSVTLGNSDWSSYAYGGTAPEVRSGTGTGGIYNAPKPSSFVGVVNSESSITLSWNLAATWGDFLRVFVRNSAGTPLYSLDIATTETSLTITGLAPDTVYKFLIADYLEGVPVYADNEVSLRTRAARAPIPDPPSDVIATVEYLTAVRVHGTNNSPYTVSIKVYRTGVSPVVARALVATVPLPDFEIDGYLDTGLTAGDTYHWDLVASNDSGNSTASDPSDDLTLPAALEDPTDPLSFSAVAVGPDAIALAWRVDTIPDTLTLEYNLDGGGSWTPLDTPDITETNYLHTGLSDETTYYYRLSTEIGASTATATANATTDPGVASAPSPPTITRVLGTSNTTMRIEWRSGDANTHSFLVRRSAHNAGSYSTIATLDFTKRTYTDSGLTLNTTYDYIIRASNTAGTGDSSATSGTTQNSLGGIGQLARNNNSRQYARNFIKTSTDISVEDSTPGLTMIDHFFAAPAAAADGPFAVLLVDGVAAAPLNPQTGTSECRNVLVAAGSAITISFSGTNAGTGSFILRTTAL